MKLQTLDRLIPYAEGLKIQLEARNALANGSLLPSLIILQHEAVITLGKNADEKGILASSRLLGERGVEVHRTGRGGQATVHSPGQLVAYPILNLRDLGLSPRNYVTALEEWLIKSCMGFGIAASRLGGKPGIYTANGKIGALGVAVSAGLTMHGIALNVCNDLSLFDLILPCGEREIRPVSFRTEGVSAKPEEVSEALERAFEAVFGAKLV